LRQVLTNIINNSIKFTPEGGNIEVTVDRRREKGDRLYLVFSVRDDGIGIPDEKQHLLFLPFMQADASTTRKYGGTGLGLQISKRLCELMGGTIEFDSTEGRGSTFKFEIRIESGHNVLDSECVQNNLPRSKKPVAVTKILVAEDNVVNQQVVSSILEKLGYQYVLVNNGEEAIRRIAQETFDLVVMDCQMPVMDGHAATRKIRESFNAEILPIIAVTANAFDGERQRCLDDGMNDYLSKPFNLKALQTALLKWH